AMFAIGRMPGWIANWKEVAEREKFKITRPRQVYQGAVNVDYMRMRDREASDIEGYEKDFKKSSGEGASENATFRA
ncbi:MAG: hypothetical protein IKO42_02640, partial [Opitutales bacterium]|nr:hypothetical protein [Opitutales bacterium]